MENLNRDSFNEFEEALSQYLPIEGEGETKASQLIKALNTLVYQWFTDGDVYDNRYALVEEQTNDLSSYANWIYNNNELTGSWTKWQLEKINRVRYEKDYTRILYNLCTILTYDKYLEKLDKQPKVDSIYTAEGPFKFVDLGEYYREYGDDDDDYLYENNSTLSEDKNIIDTLLNLIGKLGSEVEKGVSKGLDKKVSAQDVQRALSFRDEEDYYEETLDEEDYIEPEYGEDYTEDYEGDYIETEYEEGLDTVVQYNLELSVEEAEVFKEYLHELGVNFEPSAIGDHMVHLVVWANAEQKEDIEDFLGNL